MRYLRSWECDIKEELKWFKDSFSIFGNISTTQSAKKTKDIFGEALSPKECVSRIVSDIKEKGDDALLFYTEKLDGVPLSPEDIRVKESEIEEAYNNVTSAFINAIRKARENIRRFQKHIYQEEITCLELEDLSLGVRYGAIEKVGIYIPGGTASYPSTVLMNAVPAKVAGVKKIEMVTPPRKDGTVSPERLVAANEVGVDEIYKIGGAHAIAALAFGTKTIPKVDKIVGPGNIFVTLAKREVFGYVGIDILAGPSEVLIIADDTANPEYVASDLLSQAEHNPGLPVLVTTSEGLASKVKREVSKQLDTLSKRDLIKESLDRYGLIIVAKDISEVVDISNELAPEHLQIMVKNPEAVLNDIKNAGAIFIGEFSPVAVGDYIAGPSHVLPTGGTARFFSGLSVNDFLKKTSIISYNKKALKGAANEIITIAESEGLDAHAQSVKIRLK
ncbi:MAG TPA: histidinol dehydrogenase [Candidatus Brocadiia bacterium]|nr:histidinol dehydrogenase [Candidatus Brocadiales bacterium]